MTGKRTDTAQHDIVEALRNVGAIWIDMTQQRPSVGYDGVCVFRGQMWLVEIKTPGRWKFTLKELETQALYARGGVTIWVWECPEDALLAIGVL